MPSLLKHYLRWLRVRMITVLVARPRWYAAALAMSRLEANIERVRHSGRTLSGLADRLHYWISELTEFGAFPIPTRVVGLDLVRAARATGHGVLIYSTHVPLFNLVLKVMSDAACAPDLSLADTHNLINGEYQIPASSGTVAGAAAGPSVLFQLRTKLRAGGVVMGLLDREVDGPLFDNLLRLAAKLGSSLVFFSVTLGADGVIEVGFQAPPYPACDTDEELRANLAVVESFRSSCLHSLI